jgi:L-rhamnose isomerase
MDKADIESSFKTAVERYAELGVDVPRALERLSSVAVSLHCWQGDDITGFETAPAALEGSGLQVTGRRPGRARNADELRADLGQALALIPGRHRVSLHAIYGEFRGAKVDRNEIEPEHYRGWVEWAKREGVKLDFNATCFGHPRAAEGFTLTSLDNGTRKFWVDHVRASRKVAASIGREQTSPCVHNLWIPDGTREAPADRFLRRKLLRRSLDEIYETEYSAQQLKDSLESKLFGIGSESFVAGSHEFYLAYALANKKMVCLDLGHFHPTESVADKISSILLFSEEMLLHISRGVRWDSDHVVLLTDELKGLAAEIVRGELLDRVHLALDYFDAGMNRVGAWVLGARAVLKALLLALLEPTHELQNLEAGDRRLEKLVLEERLKFMPAGAVWDYYCLMKGAPTSGDWLRAVEAYEKKVRTER